MKWKLLHYSAIWALLLFIFSTVIEFHSFHFSFYKQQYQQLNIASSIGVSKEELYRVTTHLLYYIQGKQEDLMIQATIDGKQDFFFNQKEIDHMVDVKDLYTKMKRIQYGSCIYVIVVLAISMKQKKMKSWYQAYIQHTHYFMMIVGGLGFYILVDFQRFWYQFHTVFFTNDLWLLDPSVDRLIMMVPSEFFNQLVLRIILSFLAVFLMLYVFSRYQVKRSIE